MATLAAFKSLPVASLAAALSKPKASLTSLMGLALGAAPLSNTRSLTFITDNYLTRTNAAPTDTKKSTISLFIKWGTVDGYITHSWSDADNYFRLDVSSGKLRAYNYTGGANNLFYRSSTVITDTTQWHHVLLTIDTTQATAADRVKMYFDGSEQSDEIGTRPAQNATTVNVNTSSYVFNVARYGGGGSYSDFLLDEIAVCDGQTYPVSSFMSGGKPLDLSGLTFGANGAWHRFEDNTSTTTLGNDSGPNNLDFSLNGMSTSDSSTSVP